MPRSLQQKGPVLGTSKFARAVALSSAAVAFVPQSSVSSGLSSIAPPSSVGVVGSQVESHELFPVIPVDAVAPLVSAEAPIAPVTGLLNIVASEISSATSSQSLPGTLCLTGSPKITPLSLDAVASSQVETQEAPIAPADPSDAPIPQDSEKLVKVVSESSSTTPLITPLGTSSSDRASPQPSLTPAPGKENGPHKTPSGLLWANKFKASLRNLKQMSSPIFLEDGTPVVTAPASVLLKTAEMWKGHLVAQFHGLCPTSSRIFNDLNPIWGKYGNITVRVISETVSLIFVPSVATRDWVVDVGFWQAGNCSCTVYPWSPEGLLKLEELKSAPTWAILKNVPPQLYSLDGISVIASGIGEPLHTEKSRLDPINLGVTKVKVVIQLDQPLPTSVIVQDIQGNSARIEVDYPRPPPHCLNCGKYGHLLSRCPLPLMKKSKVTKIIPNGSATVSHPTLTLNPATVTEGVEEIVKGALDPLGKKTRRKRSRSSKRSRNSPPSAKGSSDLVLDSAQTISTSLTSVNIPKVTHTTSTKSAHPVAPLVAPLLAKIPSSVPISLMAATAGLLATKKPHWDDVDPDFPIPPGWGVMSKKQRKKHLKQWHNHTSTSSKTHGVHVHVQGESSSGTSRL